MIYYCEDCGFLFSRTGEIKNCPSCEVNHIRIANTEEAFRLQAILEETKRTAVLETASDFSRL